MRDEELFNKAFGNQETVTNETTQETPDVEGNDLFNKAFGTNEARYKQSEVQAIDSQPEKVSEALKLSKDYGVELDFAERNLEFLKKDNQRKSLSYEKVAEKSERVSTLFENPKNFKLGKDSVEPLSKIDAQIQKLQRYDDSPSYVSNLGKSFVTGAKNLEASQRSLFAAYGMIDTVNNDEYFETLATLNKDLNQRQADKPEYIKEFHKMYDKEWGDVTSSWEKFYTAKDDFEEGKVLDGLKNVGRGLWSAAEFVDFLGGVVSRPKATVDIAMESVAYVAPSLAASAALGTAGAAAGSAVPVIGTAIGGAAGAASGVFLGTAYTESGAWINQEISNSNYDTTDPKSLKAAYNDAELMKRIKVEAIRRGLTMGAMETAATLLGGRILTQAGKNASRARKVVKGAQAVGAEVVMEGAGEAVGTLAATKGDLSRLDSKDIMMEMIGAWGQKVASLPTTAAVAKGMQAYKDRNVNPNPEMGGDVSTDGGTPAAPADESISMGTVEVPDAAFETNETTDNVVAKAKEVAEEMGRADQAVNAADAIGEIGNAIRESKLADLDPDTARDFVNNAVTDSEIKEVYFQADEFDDFWVARGEDPVQKAEELLGERSQEYHDAKATGTPVRVDVRDVVVQNVNNENFGDLTTTVLKPSPDGMTAKQAQESIQNVTQEMDNLVKSVEQVEQRRERVRAERKQLKEEIHNRLKNVVTNSSALESVWVSTIEALAIAQNESSVDVLNRTLGTIEQKESYTGADGEVLFQGIRKSTKVENLLEDEGYINLKTKDGKANLSEMFDIEDFINPENIYQDKKPTAKFNKYERPALLENIQIEDDKQSQGLGTKLLKEAEQVAINEGFDVMFLNASPMGQTGTLEQLINFYKKNGYRVIRKSEGNAEMYKPLKKSEVLFQTGQPKAPIFYSGLAKTIKEKLKGARATKEQVMSIVNQAKKDEVESLGITEFLDTKEGMIDIEEVINFIDANGVQVVTLESTTALQSTLVEGENLIYRQVENEYGRPTMIPVVSDISEVNFQVVDRSTILNDRDVQNVISQEIDSLRDSETDNYRYELERAKQGSIGENYSPEIYLSDGLVVYLQEQGIEFENGQPSNLENFEQDELNDFVSDYYDSDKGQEELEEQAERQYLDGSSYYGMDKIHEPTLDLEIWVTTTEYGGEILRVYHDTDGAAEGMEDVEGLSVDEFIIQLRQNALDQGLFEVDPSIFESLEKQNTEPEDKPFNVMEGRSRWVSHTLTGGENYREVRLTLPQIKEKFVYETHFNDENIVAYLRLKDRTNEDGKKILYAEEIQSDWHQQGREKGYKTELTDEDKRDIKEFEREIKILNKEIDEPQKKYAEAEEKTEKIISDIREKYNIYRSGVSDGLSSYLMSDSDELVFNPEALAFDGKSSEKDISYNYLKKVIDEGLITERKLKNIHKKFNKEFKETKKIEDENLAIVQEKQNAIDQYQKQIDVLNQTEAVPQAPFRNTEAWTSLALKRLMRMAAEEGYDGVAWTPAEVHQKRWGTDRVAWKKAKDGFVVSSRDQVGGEADGTNIEELAEARGMLKRGEHLVTSKEELRAALEEVLSGNKGERALNSLSESVWEKMQATPVGKVEPRKEGFELYYNKAIPTNATKIAKSLGLKLEPMDFSDGAPKSLGVNLTDASKDKMMGEGFTLFQKNAEEIMGATLIDPETKKISVQIFTKKNMSTMLHESAHVFFNMYKIAVETGAATEETRTLYNDMLAAIGVKEGEAVTVENQEFFAEAYESWLAEGKAPNNALKKAFRMFSVWLNALYRNAVGLGIKMTPELRDVFSRMTVAQNEINEAMQSYDSTPMITDPEAQGMPKATHEKYVNAFTESGLYAGDKMIQRVMKDQNRKQKKMYKIQRAKVKKDLREQSKDNPLFNAISILSKGKFLNNTKVPPEMKGLKLNTDELALRFPEIAAKPKFSEMTKKAGISLDAAASMFQFKDAADMLNQIDQAPEYNSWLEERTDLIMNETVPDVILNDEDLQREANDALHNSDREFFIRTEYEHLAANNKGLAREITRRVVAAPIPNKDMKLQAKRIIAKSKVRELKPNQYRLAEKRYRKEAGKFFAKGDIQGAFKAKQNELMSFYLYKEASEAKATSTAKLKKTISKYKKSDKEVGKTRNIDFVMAGRAILGHFGEGPVSDIPALEYLETIKEYNPDAYNEVSKLITVILDNNIVKAKDFGDMTYDQARGIVEALDMLWALAKEDKQIDVAGQRVSIEKAVGEIATKIGDVKELPSDRTLTKFEKRKIDIMGWLATLKRFDFATLELDRGDLNGPFRTYVYGLIDKAHTEYSKENGRVQKQLFKILKDLSKRINVGQEIKTLEGEINFTFRDKSELLHAILHLGNASNREKLILGYKWGTKNKTTGEIEAPKFDRFLKRMFDDGVLVKEDIDSVQAIWDLNETTKIGAQKAHRKIFGSYFKEITADTFVTPFGNYRGGYVPAYIDMYNSVDIKDKDVSQRMIENNPSNILPTSGGKNFTISREQEFHAKLDLDLNRLSGHLESVVRFSIMKPAVSDSLKIIQNKELTKILNNYDPNLKSRVLIPALSRADKNNAFVVDESMSQGLGAITNELRKRSSIQIMAGNVGNILEQSGQIGVARQRVKDRYLLPSVLQATTNGKKQIENVKASSDFMAERWNTEDYKIQRRMGLMFQERNWWEPGHDVKLAAEDMSYWAQQSFQRVIDSSVWMGAYNQAIAEGKTDAIALHEADTIVRQTQVSGRAFDIATIQTSRWLNFFQMFMGFFNGMYNLVATDLKLILKSDDAKTRKALASMSLYVNAIFIPASISWVLKQALSGRDPDQDDDDEIYDDITYGLLQANASYMAAFIPIFGPAALVGINQGLDSAGFQSRAQVSPAIDGVSATFGVATQAVKGEVDVRKLTKVIGIATGLPIGFLGKPINYVQKYSEGEANPSGPFDAARGLVTGQPGE